MKRQFKQPLCTLVWIMMWSAIHLFASSAGLAQTKSLVIGIDGLGYGDKGFSVANTPNIDSLINGTFGQAQGVNYNGAYSDNAFAGGVVGTSTQQATSSGPGWSTFLTGVWVDQHNVPNNSFTNPDYVNNPPYLSTLKSNDNSLVMASFIQWTPIDSEIIDVIDNDGDPNNNMDYRYTGSSAAISIDAVEKLDGNGVNDVDADVIYMHYDEVDGAGHSGGSSSQGYQNEIEQTDGQIGTVLNAIMNRPNFASEDWQIIVSSDHGHRAGGGHGGTSDLERTIPFIVASQSLNQGGLPDIPGDEVSHADVAPTVLDHFGLAIPANYWGSSRATGALISDPDINGDGMVSGDGTGDPEDDDVSMFVDLWLIPSTPGDLNPADLNSDGIADIFDAAILNDALLAAGGGGFNFELLTGSVPEPSSALMAALAVIGLATTRRRRGIRA